ncbi:hypothetical protein ABE28_008705 [Peribacillus muralis]|uniref:Uncharacterized protein n=1 Tax=Peribacillus muralis TaxID=264697 RepID=A0A1B3XMK5_9BACI|nr:hypothetical protein ABE28_008705 [Peribacillus muralis]
MVIRILQDLDCIRLFSCLFFISLLMKCLFISLLMERNRNKIVKKYQKKTEKNGKIMLVYFKKVVCFKFK